ncbi:MAG TPA: hypothetical protein VNK67_04070 [Burkholderiales bacterium]|nr:hypothetical protein [Burkholderiales bacterium]
MSEVLPAIVMQGYVLLMAVAVVIGTLYDVQHKGSAEYFGRRRKRAEAEAKRRLSGGERFLLVLATIAEAAVSGEFCKWPRRITHLLKMYGFLLYVISTVVMVFGYPAGTQTPAVLPALWSLGALMILAGGLWFFFFQRVNVAFDGASPLHLGRADLFIGSLLASAFFALLWQHAQSAGAGAVLVWTLFGLYLFFTTLLFVTVPWSKFAHMFFKPAVAYQRKVEEASGSSDLPRPSAESFIVRS